MYKEPFHSYCSANIDKPKLEKHKKQLRLSKNDLHFCYSSQQTYNKGSRHRNTTLIYKDKHCTTTRTKS